MKDNKQILNEAFFKKASYEEKLAKRLPQYAPIDPKAQSRGADPFQNVAAFQVTDTDEVKKRLAGAYGVAFGNNNVKNMASRALKTFPILISDNVEPETVVMLKRLMEEQYAEYVNLLVSNQVVNLADYKAGNEDGNIAIQALDTISGNDFSKSRVANKAARTSGISVDDIFANVPLYNLLKEQGLVIDTKDTLTNMLLEDAVIVPSEDTDTFVEFFKNYADDIVELKEARDDYEPTTREFENTPSRDIDAKRRNRHDNPEDVMQSLAVKDLVTDAKRGYQGLDADGKEIYTKLTTGDIVLNQKRLDAAINQSVGEYLCRPENAQIRDRFEKATFLLQSRRIAGLEYYQYLTFRLGLPVSDAARLELIKNFKIGDIRKFGEGSTDNRISEEEVQLIYGNKRMTEKVVKKILKPSLKEVFLGIGSGISVAAAGGAIAGAALLSNPVGWTILATAAVGSGAFLIAKLIQKRNKREQEREKEVTNMTKIEGWERVESLIDDLERRQAELRKDLSGKTDRLTGVSKSSMFTSDYENISDRKKMDENIKKSQNAYLTASENIHSMVTSLAESKDVDDDNTKLTFNEMFKQENNFKETLEECAYEVALECQDDKDLKGELLSERVLSKSTMPMSVKYVEKKPGMDVMVTPSFMARAEYAYGSTEIERKENKDRKYNQPLIMTIKFKERFSDGKYSDNELTAVIGILGKVIRIPSEEMEYVLSEAAQGNTIDGIFKTADLGDTVSDMLSSSKISRQLKNLPQSADVWHNLEKVATLAAANKLSGKRSGNVANAHIVFSQKEIDSVRNETGVDFVKDTKKAVALMKKYSAFTLMVANDPGQRVCILDDQDNISWNVVPYNALMGKDTGDQLIAALSKMGRMG